MQYGESVDGIRFPGSRIHPLIVQSTKDVLTRIQCARGAETYADPIQIVKSDNSVLFLVVKWLKVLSGESLSLIIPIPTGERLNPMIEKLSSGA